MNLDQIPRIKHLDQNNFFLLAGPCAIEGEEMAMRIAETVLKITDKLKIPYIFKGSFKKANRSRIDSFTGIGDEKALKILAAVGREFDIPTVTDIHDEKDAAMAAQYVDVLQIPAFLVRQTDLVVAAAKTGRTVNLKKGQTHQMRLLVGDKNFIQQQFLEANTIPDRYALFHNFPNPFNFSTAIRYALPERQKVTLRIFNILGQEVITLLDAEFRNAGYYIEYWDGQNRFNQSVASGIYLYWLEAGNFTEIKKMTLIK